MSIAALLEAKSNGGTKRPRYSCSFNSAFSSAFAFWHADWDCGISTTSNVLGNCIWEKKVKNQTAGAETLFFFFPIQFYRQILLFKFHSRVIEIFLLVIYFAELERVFPSLFLNTHKIKKSWWLTWLLQTQNSKVNFMQELFILKKNLWIFRSWSSLKDKYTYLHLAFRESKI